MDGVCLTQDVRIKEDVFKDDSSMHYVRGMEGIVAEIHTDYILVLTLAGFVPVSMEDLGEVKS